MSRFLERARVLRATVTPHYNCAQSVVLPFAADAGISEENALRFADGFGMGMKQGSVCGVFTGGIMVLGLFGLGDPQTVGDYSRRIREAHGGLTDCADLLCEEVGPGQNRKPHCDAMVFEAVAALEEILREKGRLPGEA